MTQPLKVYKFSINRIYVARTDAEAREQLAEEIEDYLHVDIFDVNNWISEVLERNDQTEWIFRSFEYEETMEESEE